MTKAKRMMQEDIKLIDIVIELLDARAPLSSKNPDIDNLAANKSRMVILNKADMADARKTAKWEEYFKAKGFFVLSMDSRKNSGMKPVSDTIREACKEKIARDRKRGIINRPIRAMIVGIPNVGKSTFINSYAKKSCTKVGNKPGVTKGKQWIRLNRNLELLDTPGILWPKFEDQKIGEHLALIGSINDEILHVDELAVALIRNLKNSYLDLLEKRYNITMDEDAYDTLKKIAIARRCLQKGELPDVDRASSMLLEDFRSGKLGRITLERPEEWK